MQIFPLHFSSRPLQTALTHGSVCLAFMFGVTTILLLAAAAARAQELEPRAYSVSPVGTNSIAANYTRLTGGVLADPSLPITDVQAEIDLETFGYVRTFGVAGRSASLGILVPFT
jgi:hypothetical protein